MRGYTTALVPALLRMLQARGFALPPILRELELPAGCEASPDVPVTVTAVRRLAEAAERTLQDPFVGLHAAETVARGTYGLSEFIARSSSNLREALEGFARYSRLLNAHSFVRLVPRGQDLAVEQRFVGLQGDPGRHQTEFLFGVVVGMGHQVLQRPLVPRALWFSHARPPRAEELERVFGTRALEFGQRSNGMRVAAEALAWPVVSADRELRQVLSALADKELEHAPSPDDLVQRTREAISQALRSGAPRVSEVARALALSARTLQRRLGEGGLAFQELIDQVREERAKELLADPALPLGEVAFRLGYTNLGAFIRAFKSWTGKTPGELRESLGR